ncbi:MAG: hypothetical protein FGM52_15790, partial [Mycobacterium sp.]|nr:hypothetical protein [Mycobacterium sp.]
MDARTQATVRTVFNTLINWVSSLPVTATTTWLQGGLLMVRKTLFNQSAHISAVQTVNSEEVVKGRIDVLDPEGDGWKVEVVGKPGQGGVVLESTTQTDGRGKTTYKYTPGPDYSGSDRFVVKVSPTEGTRNILQPFGALNARYYTVEVGSSAVSEHAMGATAQDTLNTNLNMRNAGATVTVKKTGLFAPRYAATVTLSAASAARSFEWMDARGRRGSVSAEKMLTQEWAGFTEKAAENGVKPLLMFKYVDNGVDNVVFVDVAKVTKNTDGSFQFSGQLSPVVSAQNGRVERSDFTGQNYEKAYQTFLSSPGLKDCKTGSVCTTVTKVGTLGATTSSPSAFVADGGRDYPSTVKDASAVQVYPGQMGPGTTSVNQGNGSAVYGNTGNAGGGAQLTAMTPWGGNGSFVTATNLTQDAGEAYNGIYLYTINSAGSAGTTPTWGATPLQLHNNGWDAAVNVMTTYTQILTDDEGNPLPQVFAGTVGSVATTSYAVSGSISAANTTPATFVGVSGAVPGPFGLIPDLNSLTVNSVTSGTINIGDYVVGGPASNTMITGAGEDVFGGLAVYTLSVTQDALYSGAMTSGQGGTQLQIPVSDLPSGVDPSSLVGLLVTGGAPNTPVAEGTAIIGYTGTSGATALYTVNAFSLVGTSPLTVVGGGPGTTQLTLDVPNSVNPATLIGQAVAGVGIAANTVITGYVADSAATPGHYTYTVNNAIFSPTTSITVTTPNLYQTHTGLVVGLSDGAVEYWNGKGCTQTTG